MVFGPFVFGLIISVHNIIQILDGAKYLHFRFVLPIGIGRGLDICIVSGHIAVFYQTSYVIFIILNFSRHVTVNNVDCMQLLCAIFIVSCTFFLVLVVGWRKLSIVIAVFNIIVIELWHYFILRRAHRWLSNRIIPL